MRQKENQLLQAISFLLLHHPKQPRDSKDFQDRLARPLRGRNDLQRKGLKYHRLPFEPTGLRQFLLQHWPERLDYHPKVHGL
jgi:hypothetical protein